MKIETCDNTSSAACIIAGILAFAAVCMHGCAQSEATNREAQSVRREAIKAGLEETRQTTQEGGRWVRPAPAK